MVLTPHPLSVFHLKKWWGKKCKSGAARERQDRRAWKRGRDNGIVRIKKKTNPGKERVWKKKGFYAQKNACKFIKYV